MDIEDDEAKEDFIPREYQVDIIERAKTENVIVFLPTGSGKTFIAIKIIEHFSSDLVTKLSDGGKITIFIVNTVALVGQQASAMRKHLPFEVGEYSGEMQVDYWNDEKWHQELNKKPIVVATAQVILDVLIHGFLNISNVNVMIFDECHHAVGSHPMRQIMNLYETACEGDKPRIVGLTGSLLNCNVKPSKVIEEVKCLEETFDSKVIGAINQEMVRQYSTKPNEYLVYYNCNIQTGHGGYDLLHETKDRIVELLSYIDFPEDSAAIEAPLHWKPLRDSANNMRKRLTNLTVDACILANELGLYAAACAILISKVILLERLKVGANELLYDVLTALTSDFNYLRKKIIDLMKKSPKNEIPFKYSSDKVLQLVKIFENIPPNYTTIVFVDRRSTAQALHFIFKEFKEFRESLKHIKTDFIVGYNSAPSMSREAQLGRNINRKIIKKFKNGEINVLFASDVVEEGIDVQKCNLVIKFDLPTNFRSYTQSKGRARHKDSQYILMIPCDDDKFPNKYQQFKTVEEILKDVLCGTDNAGDLKNNSDEDDRNHVFAPFGDSGPQINAHTAISLLNRYCGMLPQDKFVKLNVNWWTTDENNGEKCAVLRLPVNSVIKKFIVGPPRRTIVSAKRLAALQACRLLHSAGELDSHLLPFGRQSEILNDVGLFPHWKNNEKELKSGTKKLSRMYLKHLPKWMKDCQPLPGKTTYVHIIKVTPNYEFPKTDRLKTFYKLLKDDSSLALLSSVKWPKVCNIPLFLNVGEVDIKMLMNKETVKLNAGEIKIIEDFHSLLFTEVWPLMRSLAVKDKKGLDESYLIAPILYDSVEMLYKLDWEVMKREKQFLPVSKIPPEERLTCEVTNETYLHKVVIPWYRAKDHALKYIVTKVLSDQNPNSPFPSNNYKSFSDYFVNQYSIVKEIVNSNQPMLEVRAISGKNNCLRPRGKHRSNNRERDDFEETLVPELCYLLSFPSVYLLKLTLVPSLLHRLHYLFVAEELRISMAEKTGLGVIDLPSDFQWDPLTVEIQVAEEEPDTYPERLKLLALKKKKTDLDNAVPWDPSDEPVDINREIDVDGLAILHFVKFTEDNNIDLNSTNFCYDFPKDYLFSKVEPLRVLEESTDNLAPQLKDLLMAFTAAKSDDIMNYERHEMLGDSFLKFAVSLALFTYFSDKDEGKLTQIKGKLLGNANLFYCGASIGIGTFIKVNPFTLPDWKIPRFSYPLRLKEFLRDSKLSFSDLSMLSASKKEVNEGVLSEETWNQIMNCISEEGNETNVLDSSVSGSLNGNDSPDPGLSESDYLHGKVCSKPLSNKDEFIGFQDVPDKLISDVVEALISVYLQTFGVEGGFKFLECVGVLPKKIFNLNHLLYSKPENPLIGSGSFEHLLKAPEKLESSLGYTFKDRGFLLQALSHPSYNHRMTDCYQRFEFLGDALLDFLITAYIYDKYKDLNPGKLTDLRSALVNNVTFACLTVRYKFHTHLLSMGCTLTDLISRFVNYQESRNHNLGTEVLYLIEESDVKIAESIDVPKVLGDIFESLAAAVYLDSGKDLKKVWEVFYRLMKDEIEKFGKDIPLNPLRVLYQTFITPPLKFGSTAVSDFGVLIPLEVVYDGQKAVFHGLGENKDHAKLAAAKQALKHFKISGWL